MLALTVLVLFVLAAAAPRLERLLGSHTGLAIAVVPALLFTWFAGHVGRVAEAQRWSVAWVPSLGIDFSFVLDGLSLVFALLITGIGALVILYGGAYFDGHPLRGRFFGLILAFAGAMLGLVLADDVITLFVFWELTGVLSYLLIGFDHERSSVRAAGLQALLVTGAGGLALLIGLLVLGGAAGTYSLSELNVMGGEIRAAETYPLALLLILVGAFTKSAQWPFHRWLPRAMAAPTPVSAYLHSATMVKAGVYLLARMDPALGDSALWVYVVTGVGAVTMLLGAVLALRETDLKRVLAYTTIAALGTLVALIGLSLPSALKAAVVFLMVHSLYKAGLFLVVGVIDHETGTRDSRVLTGLRTALPITAFAAVLSGLSMAGLPPVFGFVAKELTYKAKLGFGGGELALPVVAMVANALTVAAAGIVAVRPFLGRPVRADVHEPRAPMLVGPLLLGLAGVALGTVPWLVGDELVQPAVEAIQGGPVEVELALWYGWNVALLLSIATVALGVLLYLRRDPVRSFLGRHAMGGGRDVFAAALAALDRGARVHTALLLRGGTSRYLMVIFAAAAVLVWVGIARAGLPAAAIPRAEWLAWAIAVLVAAEALMAVRARTRLGGATALGALGFAVALLFLHAGAPDLAMTQFLVETLVVLVLMLALRRLPASGTATRTHRTHKVLAALVAVALGAGFTALLLGMLRQPLPNALAEFYAAASVAEGKGKNIVNVILVDFRALDTFGEIVVLGIAALAVLAATGMTVLPDRSRADVPAETEVSPVLDAASRLLVPLLAVVSLVLLWRGHNAPGGGFIAGLVAVGAIALRIQARGAADALAGLRVSPQALVGAGLLIALASGAAGLFAGAPFMAGLWLDVPLPTGLLKLGTPLLFDVGVYTLVLGFGATVLFALEAPHG